MGNTFIIILIGVGVFFIYRYFSRKRLGNIYETESPIDTQDFTFEKAVEGCCVAVAQISELDTKLKEVDEIILRVQNPNEHPWSYMLKKHLGIGIYKKNENYPESEKNREYRLYNQKIEFYYPLGVFIVPSIIALPGLLFPIMFTLASIVFALGMSAYLIIIFFPFNEIGKDRKRRPWLFNTQPIGSQRYILQQEFNDALEETHRIYYDLYLPCKRKADELIIYNSNNRDSEYYNAYREVVKYEADIYNCTPKQRIRKFQEKRMNNNIKIATILTVATVAATGIFMGMINRGGKDMFKFPQNREKWIDKESGKEYDHNPINDL